MNNLSHLSSNAVFGSKHLEALGIPPGKNEYWRKCGYIRPLVTAPGQGNFIMTTRSEFLRVAVFKHLLDRGLSHQISQEVSDAFTDRDWDDVLNVGLEFFVVMVGKGGGVIKMTGMSQSGAFGDLDFEEISGPTEDRILLVINALELAKRIEQKLSEVDKAL